MTSVQYLQTRRLLLAKQLLTDTQLPVAQVALASGFKSLRRFNAAFADSYRMSPTRLRGANDSPTRSNQSTDEGVSVMLGYRAPLDATALLRFIAQRAIPGVEVIDGQRVRRTLRSGVVADASGWVEVEFISQAAQVRLRMAASLANASGALIAAVRRWLDLDAAPQTITAALVNLPGVDGIRLPGGLDAFELATRAVLGQQVTVAAARTLAARLVERFGAPIATPWAEVNRLFPSPQVLAATSLERIAELGIIRTRAGAIIALAQAWPMLHEQLRARAAPEALIERLSELPGIGPWTAHYIAMRALGWPDAFLPNDVALQKAMKQLFNIHTQREADAHAQAWQPWRSYAVLRLWNSLEKTA